MTLEQRVRKLERENRWMRRIAAVTVAVVAVVGLVGQGKEEKLPDLEVRSLVIRDEDGRARAQLATREKDGSPFLTLWDRAKRGSLTLTTLANGSSYLSLIDKSLSATLGTQHGGHSYLRITHKDGKIRAALVTSPTGASLQLSDAKGKVIWQAPR